MFIVIILISCICYCVYAYSFDHKSIPTARSLQIHKPSSADFEEITEQNSYILRNYEKEVIEPFYEYSQLEQEISTMIEKSEKRNFYALPLYWGNIFGALVVEFGFSYLFAILSVVIAIALIFPLGWICEKIFPRHKSKIFTRSSLRDEWKYEKNHHYPITSIAQFNNYIIANHYFFLRMNYEKIKMQYTVNLVSVIISAIMFLILVLFFIP